MRRIYHHLKNFLSRKYHKFNNSDSSFEVMLFCYRLIGFQGNLQTNLMSSCLLLIFKRSLVVFAVIYTFVEAGCICYFRPVAVREHFEILFMTFGRLVCIIAWDSLALNSRGLKQIWIFLFDSQRKATDDRRRSYVRTINWFTLIVLLVDTFPALVWSITGRIESPLALFNSDLLDVVNSGLNRIAVVLLTLMFCTSIVAVCSILLALTMEFQLLGLDFVRIFDGIESLNDAKRWDKVSQSLQECVQRHQSLLNTAVSLRGQLQTYFLVQLGIDFIAIVLSVFVYLYAQRYEDTSFGFSVFGALANTSNLLLYGYLCDRLEDQVTAINHQLYCSAWVYKMNGRKFGQRYRSLSRSILIVMQRTQKRIGFTCGNFFAMSLVTCRKVLWFAYSVLAVLISFLE